MSKYSYSTFVGSCLLIMGSCIGAGMLGMPYYSIQVGFIPSVVCFLIAFFIMLAGGYFIIDCLEDESGDDINLSTLVSTHLGKLYSWVAGFLFLFLFFSLMVAFTAGGSSLLLNTFVPEHLATDFTQTCITLFFAAASGLLIFLGTESTDYLNRILMLGLVLSYVVLLVLGLPHIEVSYLSYASWEIFYIPMPVMVLGFGYHNLVPTLYTYLNKDGKALRRAIFIATGLCVLIYCLWNMLFLGLIDPYCRVCPEGGNDQMTVLLLKDVAAGSSLFQWVSPLAILFSLFALITSYIGVGLSMVDFLRDALGLSHESSKRAFLSALVVLLPAIITMTYPELFFVALRAAGSYGAIILYGIFPALMVIKKRTHFKLFIPSLLVILASIGVIILEILS